MGDLYDDNFAGIFLNAQQPPVPTNNQNGFEDNAGSAQLDGEPPAVLYWRQRCEESMVECNRRNVAYHNLKLEVTALRTRLNSSETQMRDYQQRLVDMFKREEPLREELNKLKEQLLTSVREQSKFECEAESMKASSSQIQALLGKREEELSQCRKQVEKLVAKATEKTVEAKRSQERITSLEAKYKKLKEQLKEKTEECKYNANLVSKFRQNIGESNTGISRRLRNHQAGPNLRARDNDRTEGHCLGDATDGTDISVEELEAELARDLASPSPPIRFQEQHTSQISTNNRSGETVAWPDALARSPRRTMVSVNRDATSENRTSDLYPHSKAMAVLERKERQEAQGTYIGGQKKLFCGNGRKASPVVSRNEGSMRTSTRRTANTVESEKANAKETLSNMLVLLTDVLQPMLSPIDEVPSSNEPAGRSPVPEKNAADPVEIPGRVEDTISIPVDQANAHCIADTTPVNCVETPADNEQNMGQQVVDMADELVERPMSPEIPSSTIGPENVVERVDEESTTNDVQEAAAAVDNATGDTLFESLQELSSYAPADENTIGEQMDRAIRPTPEAVQITPSSQSIVPESIHDIVPMRMEYEHHSGIVENDVSVEEECDLVIAEDDTTPVGEETTSEKALGQPLVTTTTQANGPEAKPPVAPQVRGTRKRRLPDPATTAVAPKRGKMSSISGQDRKCAVSNYKMVKENRSYAAILDSMLTGAGTSHVSAYDKWMKKPKGMAATVSHNYIEAVKRHNAVPWIATNFKTAFRSVRQSRGDTGGTTSQGLSTNDKKLADLLKTLMECANVTDWKELPDIMTTEIQRQLSMATSELSSLQCEALCRWAFYLCHNQPLSQGINAAREILLTVVRRDNRPLTHQCVQAVLNVFLTLAMVWPAGFHQIVADSEQDLGRILLAIFRVLLWTSPMKSKAQDVLEHYLGDQSINIGLLIGDQHPCFDVLIREQLGVLSCVRVEDEQNDTEFISCSNKLALMAPYCEDKDLSIFLEASMISALDWNTISEDDFVAMGGYSKLIADIALLAKLSPYCQTLLVDRAGSLQSIICGALEGTNGSDVRPIGQERLLLVYATLNVAKNLHWFPGVDQQKLEAILKCVSEKLDEMDSTGDRMIDWCRNGCNRLMERL